MIARLVLGHGLALACVLCDLTCRSVRLRFLVSRTGAALSLRDAVRVNSWSDLAAAVSPMRLAGEPTRLAALGLAGVPVRHALAALAIEISSGTPVTILMGFALAAAFGQAWWEAFSVRGWFAAWWGWIAVMVLGVVAITWWRRAAAPPGETSAIDQGADGPRAAVAGHASTVAAAAGLTLLSVGARVGVLPALSWACGSTAAWGVMALWSFVLLYGQLLTPIPSGAGIIDAAFLAGVGGPSAPALLVAWRLYTATLLPGVGGVTALAYAWPRRRQLRAMLTTAPRRLSRTHPSGARS